MRNLVQLNQLNVDLTPGLLLEGSAQAGGRTSIAVDVDAASTCYYVCRVSETGRLCISSLGNPLDGQTGSNLRPLTVDVDNYSKEESVAFAPSAEIACFSILPGERSFFVALKSGELLFASGEEDIGTAIGSITRLSFECVGHLPKGISAATWSPDYEILSIIADDHVLTLLGRDFEIIYEGPVHASDDDAGKDAPVSVGWGKKETQFHGSEGKQAAVRQIEHIQQITQSDNLLPHISWRGDGAYFCCSSVTATAAANAVRRISIYDRTGTLQARNEPLSLLEHSLAWKPSGGLIASTQQLPQNRRNVIFFERNGLRHGEFTLPTSAAVSKLHWNCDSTILAVIFQTGTVQLWASSNYTWYLKYETSISNSSSDDNLSFLWHPERPLCFATSGNNGSVLRLYDLCWDVFTSECDKGDTLCMTGVVNGSKLLATPFAVANVPPPMSLGEISSNRDSGTIAYASFFGEMNAALLGMSYTATNGVDVFSITATKSSLKYEHVAYLDYCTPLCQVFWISNNVIIGLNNSANDQHVVLFDVALQKASRLCVDAHVGHVKRAVVPRGSAASYPADLYFENSHGEIFSAKLCNSDGEVDDSFSGAIKGTANYGGSSINVYSIKWSDFPDSGFSTFCPWFSKVFPFADSDEGIDIGLCEKNKLSVNGQVVLSNCLSYCVSLSFLMATTTDHLLRFYPLTVPISAWRSPPASCLADQKSQDYFEECLRRVERGARIVLAVPTKAALVLQMPRGNLETVYPRALVLFHVRQLLDTLQYRAAYLACRHHRIDLNFLHDHSPALFMSTLAKFVSEVSQVDYLNLFLSSLRDENVNLSKYAGFSSQSMLTKEGASSAAALQHLSIISGMTSTTEGDNPTVFLGKVNRVCDSVRELIEVDPIKYVETIMTAYVCRTPSDTEAALKSIISLTENPSLPDATVEKSLKYLIFLVGAEKLYEVALGLYNLPLALSVARRSQMDPKEYLPFLEELSQLDSTFCNFRINDYLHRYELALRCLATVAEQPFELFLQYMRKHELYRLASQLMSDDYQKYSVIMQEFGAYLREKGDAWSAVSAFKLAGCDSDALKVAIQAGSWRDALSIAHKLQYNQEDVLQMSADLAKVLCRLGNYHDAFIVCSKWAKNIEGALEIAITGRLWHEAILLAQEHGQLSWIFEQVEPAVLSEYTRVYEDVESVSDGLRSKCLRIELLQHKLFEAVATNPSSFGEAGNLDDISDTLSEISFKSGTASTGSNMSQTSRSSKKSKKKTDRHRLRDKPGSVHEREFLHHAIGEMIMKLHVVLADVGSLLKTLCECGHHVDEARRLQYALSVVLDELTAFVARFNAIKAKDPVPNAPMSIEGSDMSNVGSSRPPLLLNQPLSTPLSTVMTDPLQLKFDLGPEFYQRSWMLAYL